MKIDWKPNRQEVAQILDDFLDGREDHRFGCLLDGFFNDPLITKIQEELNQLETTYPPLHGPNEFCNSEGKKRIRELVRFLRSDSVNGFRQDF
jgi:hypothetical protein